MMADPPAWFMSFCACELCLQFPYFVVAVSAFWKGAEENKWIRLPHLVYCSHVATTVVAIVAHIMFEDFSKSKFPGPENIEERLTLISIYIIFLILPFIMLLDSLFSKAYREQSKTH